MKKLKTPVSSEASNIHTVDNFIKNHTSSSNFYYKFLVLLKSLKPRKLRKKEESPSKIEQLELSIPSKSNCDEEIHLFILRLRKNLQLYSTWKVRAVMQEAVRHITWHTKDGDGRDIKIIVVRMKRKIIMTISCANKTANDSPFPTPLPQNKLDLEMRNIHMWHIYNLPDRISFLKNGTEVRLFFHI